jgi:ribosomal protein L40E
MVYCASCGQKLEENFYFCPRCGVKTKAGTIAGATEQWEDMKKAFTTAAEQMNKAFTKAAEETRTAFEEARKEIQVHATSKRKSVCSNCGATNSPESRFCNKCGKQLS